MKKTTWLACVAITWIGCGPMTHTVSDSGPGGSDAGEIEVGASTQALIGAPGGTVVLEGARLEIPAGALAEDTLITITVTDAVVEDPFVGFSPVFAFEPHGLRFASPVTVTLPFTGSQELATLYWTVGETDAYAALETRIEGGLAVAETEHFSSAFVGTACHGSCCGRGRGELDVLLSVDNSNSMAEAQVTLAAQIPHIARALATGDVDGDGIQDVPAVRSVRIGTVSSDMGTGGFAVPTCARSDFGDDGVLRTQGRTDIAGCLASYPAWAELDAGASPSDLDAFVSQVSCTAQLGTGGCGFEQQLESVIKAVTPSAGAVTFHAGTGGNADGANAGFLRPGAILATILLTDENDCSAADPDLFNPSSATYGGTDLNLRCSQFGGALHSPRRFVDALRASRSDPDDVVYALIGGVPVDLAGADPVAILADPRMIETVDPVAPNRLAPSCDVAGRGMAFPPTRMVEVARELGHNATVQSICQEDFGPVVDAILRRVADRVSGSCGAP